MINGVFDSVLLELYTLWPDSDVSDVPDSEELGRSELAFCSKEVFFVEQVVDSSCGLEKKDADILRGREG